MRYLNVPCPCCGKPFVEDDDVVTCPTCGTPHHRDCWFEKGSCVNTDLHVQDFVWKVPVAESVPVAPVVASAATQNQPATVECPFCGARNYANELYCTVCHEPIHQNASADAGEPLQDEEQREKMYADFRTYGGLDPQSVVGDVSVKEYSAYVGEKSGNYIRRFMMLQVRNRIVSWNWAAFWSSAVSMLVSITLGPVWFFYRKMYKYGAVYMAILLGLGIATAFVFANEPAYWEMTDRIHELYATYLQTLQQEGADIAQVANDIMANINAASQNYLADCSKLTYMWSYVTDALHTFLLPIVAGSLGTGLYFRKAKSDILSVRAQHGDSESYLQMLRKKGGVSVGAAIGAAAVCIVLALLQTYLPLILRAVGIV